MYTTIDENELFFGAEVGFDTHIFPVTNKGFQLSYSTYTQKQ